MTLFTVWLMIYKILRLKKCFTDSIVSRRQIISNGLLHASLVSYCQLNITRLSKCKIAKVSEWSETRKYLDIWNSSSRIYLAKIRLKWIWDMKIGNLVSNIWVYNMAYANWQYVEQYMISNRWNLLCYQTQSGVDFYFSA